MAQRDRPLDRAQRVVEGGGFLHYEDAQVDRVQVVADLKDGASPRPNRESDQEPVLPEPEEQGHLQDQVQKRQIGFQGGHQEEKT
jgi:hypothetical protein